MSNWVYTGDLGWATEYRVHWTALPDQEKVTVTSGFASQEHIDRWLTKMGNTTLNGVVVVTIEQRHVGPWREVRP